MSLPEDGNVSSRSLFHRTFIVTNEEEAISEIEISKSLKTITYTDFVFALKRYTYLDFKMT